MTEIYHRKKYWQIIGHNSDVPIKIIKNKLAYADRNELVVQKLNCKDKRTRFICDHVIDFISWSPDSELVCCAMFKQGLIQVWSLVEPSWRCKISEGMLEISDVRWTPDSRHLIVTCESNLKITIWSLVSSGFTVIKNPKFTPNCISFSNCSKYFAVLERHNNTESIGIYSCDGWQNLKHFPISMDNASEIQFSPSDLVIAVLAATSEKYEVQFYSIDGRLLNTYFKSNCVLGITSLCWNAKSNCILLGDYFEKMTILNGRSYTEVFNADLPEMISNTETNIYILVKHAANDSFSNYKVMLERPYTVPSIVDVKKGQKLIKSGIYNMQLCPTEPYISIISNSKPNVIYIFNLKTFRFSDVIVHDKKIRNMSWHPTTTILAFHCGNNCLEQWLPKFCIHLPVPIDDAILFKQIEWCNSDYTIVLHGKDNSAVINFPER